MESPVFRRVVEVDNQEICRILRNNKLNDFVDFVNEKKLNGKTILDITKADIKLWKVNADTDKFLTFVKEFKRNPHKFTVNETVTRCVNETIEYQYQTVNINHKVKEKNKTIDEIMKNIVPAKSFLYRYQKPIKLSTPYVPMDATPKKTRKFFALSSYDYPSFDLKSRFSRNESDRGYYTIKTDTQNTNKTPESKRKCKSISTTQELTDEISDEHFYEDLCYNDMKEDNDKNPSTVKNLPQINPCVVKIQELFNSFKLPFFKKDDTKETLTNKVEEEKVEVKEKLESEIKQDVASVHLYENNDSTTEVMYDYPVKRHYDTLAVDKQNDITVEDYLEPIPIEREYCDIGLQKEDSLLTYIMNMFDNLTRKDTTEDTNSEGPDMENKADTKTGTEKPKKVAERKLRSTSMADRPLPVPVENEPYYMSISRVEAENLLMGHPDGTFVLRPTTQTNHAYTISVACCNSVHNVGVRRRDDGRLALGFSRKGERSFTSITSLLRYHRKRRLVLVGPGGVLGATTLNESPKYYQTPKSLPVCVTSMKS